MLRTKLKPDVQLSAIFDVSYEMLQRDNVQTLLLDVNNTLISPQETKLSDKTLEHLIRLQKQGLQIVLVSNNRNRTLKHQLKQHELKYIEHALKPFRFRILPCLKSWNISPTQLGVLGDQLFTDVYLGKRLKARTYWVKPLSTHDHLSTHWLRGIEAWVMR